MTKPFITCPTCGATHTPESFGLTVSFPTLQDRDMFVELAKRELKTATVYPMIDPPDQLKVVVN